MLQMREILTSPLGEEAITNCDESDDIPPSACSCPSARTLENLSVEKPSLHDETRTETQDKAKDRSIH